jgi:hypothetical protein
MISTRKRWNKTLRQIDPPVTEMVNACNVPAYIKQAKLMLLSKKSGACCKITDTRGIQLMTFAFKVMKKVIYARIMDSGLFETGSYQAGFKRGQSCKTDQTKLLDGLNRKKRRRLEDKGITTLFDISAAFYCVDRPKLWKIVYGKIDEARAAAIKAKAPTEELLKLDDMKAVISMLKELYRDHTILAGDTALPTHNGVI